MDLQSLCGNIRNFVGVTRKRPIEEVFQILGTTHHFGEHIVNYGDDAAAIPWGEEYLLLAADGMMPSLLMNEPYAAGKASVMVTVNDIYAMGGHPLGMVNVLSSGKDQQRKLILQGIQRGCEKLRVPMLGGHVHPDASRDTTELSVAILGYTRSLIRSHLASPGDDLVLAVDLEGQAGCRSVVSWDANSGKNSEELIDRLEVLPAIADKGLVSAGKDISNAGILGTIAIMIENSGNGGIIDLDKIPNPTSVDFDQWMMCFQSYGFILASKPSYTSEIQRLFKQKHITASVVGSVIQGDKVEVRNGNDQEILFDFLKEPITGIRYKQ